MLISDHIATAIPSPLIGANIDELGERFSGYERGIQPQNEGNRKRKGR